MSLELEIGFKLALASRTGREAVNVVAEVGEDVLGAEASALTSLALTAAYTLPLAMAGRVTEVAGREERAARGGRGGGGGVHARVDVAVTAGGLRGSSLMMSRPLLPFGTSGSFVARRCLPLCELDRVMDWADRLRKLYNYPNSIQKEKRKRN